MSLFNRPAWAKSETTNDTDGNEANIFSHSNRSYRAIVTEQERKKQAKLQRKKAKEERRSSEKREAFTHPDGDTSNKRQRISSADAEEDFHDLRDPSELIPVALGYHYTSESPNETPKRRSLRKRVDTTTARPINVREQSVETVDSRESDVEKDVAVTASVPQVDVAEEDTDDEFAELARRAREGRQQTEQHFKPDLARQSQSQSFDTLDTGQHGFPAPAANPKVNLFISSRIPDTKDLIVRLTLSQTLALARKAWCGRNGFSEEEMKDVFLIHRMRRVYDVTSCRSLGLEVDALGNLTMKGSEFTEGLDKVHLEAVTDEIFAQMKEERLRESAKLDGDASPNAETEEAQEAEKSKRESRVHLVLKAQDKAEFRLIVHPTTRFSKIVAAYAKERLSANENAYLSFDGERLNADDEVQDTEISDMDCVDVYISKG